MPTTIVARNITWRQDGEAVNLYGKQGTTWEIFLLLQNPDGTTFDASTWSGRGMIRKDPSVSSPAGTFTVTTMALTDGHNLRIYMTAAQTAALQVGKTQSDSLSTFQYDIELYKGTPEQVARVIQGKLYVDPECTR